MNYKVYIYMLMLFITAFSLSGINFNNLFKKNHIIEAKIFIMLIALSISYLASRFIIDFLNLWKDNYAK